MDPAQSIAAPVAPREAGPWPRRLAWWTWAATIPLVLLGAAVTSTGSGLAIDGWWIVDPGKGDFFLPIYPLDRWVHSVGTFVEHMHREFGMLVGLLAIATVVASFTAQKERAPRVLSIVALLLVCAQGALGGFRVLEKSTDLAFLHGAFGQLVFAFLALNALTFGAAPRGCASRAGDAERTRALKLASALACAVVYVQIVVGAWLRHGQSTIALVAHVVFVVAVLGAVVLLGHLLGAAAAGAAGAEGAEDAAPLRKLRRDLWIVTAAQIVLGLLAFLWVYLVRQERTTDELHHALFPTLHVIGGSALLFTCVRAAVHAWRRGAPAAPALARDGAWKSDDAASGAIGAAR